MFFTTSLVVGFKLALLSANENKSENGNFLHTFCTHKICTELVTKINVTVTGNKTKIDVSARLFTKKGIEMIAFDKEDDLLSDSIDEEDLVSDFLTSEPCLAIDNVLGIDDDFFSILALSISFCFLLSKILMYG